MSQLDRKALAVRQTLQAAGVPILRPECHFSDASLFEISGEGDMPLKYTDDGKWYYADYYEMYWGTDDLNKLLQDNDLMFEWINPAVMGVYHA